MKKKHVEFLVIGGGISGSSTALFLNKKKQDFCLVEANNQLGGVIKTEKIDGFTCENGPNTILRNNQAISMMIKDLDLEKYLIYPNHNFANKFFLHKGKIVGFPNSFTSFIFTKLIPIKEKLLTLRNFFYFKKNSSLTVKDFFEANFGKKFHDNIIEPFMNGIYAGNTSKISFKHSMPNAYNIFKKYKSFSHYLIYKRKNKYSKLPFSINGGYSVIFTKIKLLLQKKILLNHEVIDILFKDDEYIVKFKNNNQISCNKIIFTLQPKTIFKLLKYKTKNKFKDLYNPIDVFHFGFKEKYLRKKISGFGLLSKKSEKSSFLGVLFSSDIFPHLAPKGFKLYTILAGGEKQSYLCKKPVNELLKNIESEIKDLFKIEKIQFKKSFRWNEAIPKYNHDIIDELSQEIQILKIKHKNIFIHGNYLNGVSVSQCIQKSHKLVSEISRIK